MRRPRKGFSLVLSLTIMAAMVMLVIVLAAFLQVESKLALAHNGYMRARFNALVAARIAIAAYWPAITSTTLMPARCGPAPGRPSAMPAAPPAGNPRPAKSCGARKSIASSTARP